MKLLLDFTWLSTFANSNSFIGFCTILTGLIAYFLYRKQKQDEKVKAARVILSEIRDAENRISEIKKNKVVSDFSSVLNYDSWSKYSYLFVKDLDSDELDLINTFYSNCSVIEQQIQIYKTYLPVSTGEKTKIIQHKLLELADIYKDEKDDVKYNKHRDTILDRFHKEDYWFLPSAPKAKLIDYIGNVNYITTSTCGAKLKKIAQIS